MPDPSSAVRAGKASRQPGKSKPRKATTEPLLSRTRRPADLPVADWQAALRRQFGSTQAFVQDNLGSEPVFSEFRVHNPASGSSYRVAIRGAAPGDNACSCLDYATNHLGTCKHIEFTLARLARRRGGKAALARGFTPAFSELRLCHAGPRQLRFHPGSACPPKLLAQARKLFDPAAADSRRGWPMPPERIDRIERIDQIPALLQAAQQAGHDVRCDDAVWPFIAQLRDADQRRAALAAAYPKGATDKGLRKLLKVPLYTYQAEGALFAARAGRALIGDEMGLGKTVQAIAAAELLARHFGVRRVLVVCPTSLKHQWRCEFARFTERAVQVVHGLRARRAEQFADDDAFCKIVHYDTLARDADLITAWAPDLVIADEAQRIKNWNTIAARALKRISSPYAIVLTGTPLENRLEELISIVQFVDQHRLGPTWRLLDEHQTRDDAGRVVGYRALDRISQTLAPLLLRRRKADVLSQLPERVDQRIFVPLTPEQRLHHDEHGVIVTRIVARWRKTGYLSDVDQRRLQCALQAMRMVCNSTYLLDHSTDHGHKADELMALLDELFQTPGTKAVVFSQWLLTHELIVRRLQAQQGRGWGHVLFNGSVPGDKRGALVERFHDDPDCRLFLATDAGGVGLNLQHAAAVVVNMDMPWNPAVLEQRIGRVHRMGQTRGVQVVNFVGQGSIEEGMLSVLAFKSSLFAGVLDGGNSEVFLQGTRLSQFMQSVEQVAGAMGEAELASDGAVADGRTVDGQLVDAQPVDGQPVDGKPVDAQPVDAQPVSAQQQDADALQPAPPADHDTALPVAAEATADLAPDELPPLPSPAPSSAPATMPAMPADPLAALLDIGGAFLQSLAAARANGSAPSNAIAIERDPATGQASLRLPLPDPALLQKLAQALEPWLRPR